MDHAPLRVVHYINQFFGGIGGEEHANTPVNVRSGPVGPGRGLEQQWGGAAHVVATLVGGPHLFSTVTFTVLDGRFRAAHPRYLAAALVLPLIVLYEAGILAAWLFVRDERTG